MRTTGGRTWWVALMLKVIDIDRRRNRLILSERLAVRSGAASRRNSSSRR